LAAALTIGLCFDAIRFSHADHHVLACFHPWLLGYLVA
jgi:hypothetical protein